ncbi:hypothetical protein PPYR_00142 [Photinus pyralis]|uniref:Uncharacterized protein n=1 Tax=Photinus pyralis TaxID=7054 RepID=A0A5N4B0Q4_PHOPY|nr:hypothetical protein PPYR_00142 [Photinus pyralis]
MNDILYKKPDIEAVATCSSHTGLVKRTDKENNSSGLNELKRKDTEEESDCSASSSGSASTSGCKKFKTTFTKKRELQNAVERRHRERLQRQDRFLKTFEDYVNILKKQDDDN